MSAANLQSSRTEPLATMPEGLVQEFTELLIVQSSSENEKRMVLYLADQLRKMRIAFEIDEVGNILLCKGKAKTYPCIVAHLDTVHSIRDSFKIHINFKQGRQLVHATSLGKEVGCGGDDKCGIYACLYMLRHFDNLKVVFFTREESGLIGSSKIDTDWFGNVGYIIQLDRWGRSDLICVNGGQSTVNDKFLKQSAAAMLKYGYTKEEGLITDSINLWNNNIGISCVNVSCGYYQHHTSTENIDLNEFWNSLLFTEAIIAQLGETKYPSMPKYNKKKWLYNNYDYDIGWDDNRTAWKGYGTSYLPSLPKTKKALPMPEELDEKPIDDFDDDDDEDEREGLSRFDCDTIENIEFEIPHFHLDSHSTYRAFEMFNDERMASGRNRLSLLEFENKIEQYYYQ